MRTTKPGKLNLTKRIFLFVLTLALTNCQDSENLTTQEQSRIKTVSINDAKAFLTKSANSPSAKLANSEIGDLEFDKATLEKLNGSDQFLTVIPFATNNEVRNDRVLVVKIDDVIRSVILSMQPDENSVQDHFSGKVFIYSLEGDFITGYGAKDGLYERQYLKEESNSKTSKNPQDGEAGAYVWNGYKKPVNATDWDAIWGSAGSSMGWQPVGGASGVTWDATSGGGSGASSPPSPNSNDPCNTAKAITADTKSPAYTSAKSNIDKASVDGLEHSITLGKDANGNVTQSPMSSGGANKVKVNTTWVGAFGSVHNHPNDTQLSAGDIYAGIVLNTNNSNFTTSFIVTGGETYAIVVSDLVAAKAFAAAYPADQLPGYNPEFPDVIFDQLQNLVTPFGSTIEGKTKAIALVLDQLNSGITLLKQDANGEFHPIKNKETKQSNGTSSYTATPCK